MPTIFKPTILVVGFFLYIYFMKIPEIKKLEDILVEVLGEPKVRYYDEISGQRIFNCPCCAEENGGIPDGKYNLEISFEKALNHGGVFNCWKCSSTDRDMSGRVFKLLKRYASPLLYKEYKNTIQDIVNSKLYDINAFSAYTETELIEDDFVILPKTYCKINLNEENDEDLVKYLHKRNIDQDMIDKFSIGYTSNDVNEDYQYRNCIIVPSYDRYGELNYYLGRDFTGKNKFKYCNCKNDKKKIIFQESLIDWDSPIYLCEGVFDAMRFPQNGISMLGKVLTRNSYLYQTIYSKANSTVTIVLDGDTTDIEIKQIYMLLDFGRLKDKIYYIDMKNDCKYKDMSEVYENEGKMGVIKMLCQQKQFSEIELLF